MTERAPAAESSSVMKARRPAVMHGSSEMARKTDGWLSAALGAHRLLACVQAGEQRGGVAFAGQRAADGGDGVVESGEAAGVHQKDRDAHALDAANGLGVVERGDADGEVGMQDGDALQRGTQHAADARLLPRLGRILRVVGDAHDVGSGADGIDRVGDAGREADDAVDVIGQRDLASRLVGERARGECGQREGEQRTAAEARASHCSLRWIECFLHATSRRAWASGGIPSEAASCFPRSGAVRTRARLSHRSQTSRRSGSGAGLLTHASSVLNRLPRDACSSG